MKYKQYKYFDSAINGWNQRNKVTDRLEIKPSMIDTGRTYFRFDADYYQHWREKGTVKGFNGKCYADYLPIDIDNKSREDALTTVKNFLEFLNANYDVEPGTILVWFSGNSGFHIALPIALFGDITPSVDLPDRFKAFVMSEWGSWPFDFKIYEKNRLFRCENTINSKSGLYKIRINNVLHANMKEIEEKAKAPGVQTYLSECYDCNVNQKLSELFKQCKTSVKPINNKTAYGDSKKWRELVKHGIPKGNRNNTGFDIARYMKYDNQDRDCVKAVLEKWNTLNNPPMSEQEINGIMDSVFLNNSLSNKNQIYPRSDAGNAELIVSLFNDKLRFNHSDGEWYIFNGQYWVPDKTDEIKSFAIKAARKRQSNAVSLFSDKDDRKKEFSFGIASENSNKIQSALELVKSFTPISSVNKDWQQNPYLIQFENGVYDLENDFFRQGAAQDMIFQSVGYCFDEKAKCPLWEKTINEVFDNNPSLIDYVHEIIGYSITGLTSEHCLFILNGNGCNGKSVIINTISAMMGSYAINSPFSAFEAYNNNQSNDLARLAHARIVTSSESGQSKRFNEERLKLITGGDPVTARFLYREYFTYVPKFKVWLAVNTLPDIKGTDDGIWRRIKVIPFKISFKNREDKTLSDKLLKEIPGIMNWAIEGFKKYQKKGLNPPKDVESATSIYRAESDLIASFIDECTHRGSNIKIKARDLYRAYSVWCTESGTRSASQTLFGRRIKHLGYESEKLNGIIYYKGIELIETEDTENNDPYSNISCY